jgi:hypothetical protein
MCEFLDARMYDGHVVYVLCRIACHLQWWAVTLSSTSMVTGLGLAHTPGELLKVGWLFLLLLCCCCIDYNKSVRYFVSVDCRVFDSLIWKSVVILMVLVSCCLQLRTWSTTIFLH